MFDVKLRQKIDPVLTKIVKNTFLIRLNPTSITIFGFFIGILGCSALYAGNYSLALALLFVNRICDGLDGIIAREKRPTLLGGYLDIVLDFLFYSGYVFAFGLGHPTQAVFSSFLIFSFVGTGSSFLTFAIMEQKLTSRRAPMNKSFHYLGGLTEGTETIAALALFTIFPEYFPLIAIVFGAMCWITVVTRIIQANVTLSAEDNAKLD